MDESDINKKLSLGVRSPWYWITLQCTLGRAKVRTLTNYGHCCGYHTVLFYTPLCRASSCPTFQPPPVTYYYIIHTQSDIPITSGEKSHIPTKPKGRRNLGLRQERSDLNNGPWWADLNNVCDRVLESPYTVF